MVTHAQSRATTIGAKVARPEENLIQNTICRCDLKKKSKPLQMEITVQDLRQRLEAGETFVFIDVREPWEFEEFNLGAQLIPLNTLVNSMNELEEHKDHEIVVHCRSGARSAMAQGLLLANGFKNVRNLKGGVMAWQEAFGNTKP